MMNRAFLTCLLVGALVLLVSCGEAPETENTTQTRLLCDSENVATSSFCPGCMSVEAGQIFVGSVEFEHRPPGAWVYKQVPIENLGAGKLRITSIDFDGAGVFSLYEDTELCLSKIHTVDPGKRAMLDVIYHGGEVSSGEAKVAIESNDPDEHRYIVRLNVLPREE